MDTSFVEEPQKESFWDKFKDSITELIEFAAIMGAILLVIHLFIAEPHRVSGTSMEPNFDNGDFIITDKISQYFNPYQRGEVIILKNPRDTSQIFIKRIVGMPGETITLHDGSVYINGKKLNEPYLNPNVKTYGRAFLHDDQNYKIPKGYYFVMGDHRSVSSDSREWGPLKADLIIGYPWLRYWPPNRFAFIHIDKPSNQ